MEEMIAKLRTFSDYLGDEIVSPSAAIGAAITASPCCLPK